MNNKPHRPISSRQEKIDWLLKNQDLWEGYPNDANRLGDNRTKSIIDKMKEEGLVSKSTYWPDLKLGSLISEARKLRREGRK